MLLDDGVPCAKVPEAVTNCPAQSLGSSNTSFIALGDNATIPLCGGRPDSRGIKPVSKATGRGTTSPTATGGQNLGNPLLLRRPLDLGLRVVALHAASDGEAPDLDDASGRQVPAFDLLLRLLEEPRYDDLLYAGSAAMTFFNHLDRPLRVFLEREDLQRRLVHGSDYPLCAVNVALRTSDLADYGFLTKEEGKQLNEIYDCNPLLFDLVVKRTLRHPETGARLVPDAFLEPAGLSAPK